MPTIVCKFTPTQGGSEFTVANITEFSFQFHRPPSDNGHVGMRNHFIGQLHFVRKKSFQDGGTAKLEDETVKLAAAVEKKAYFKGEVTLARDDDTRNKIQTVRWDEGHICNFSSSATHNEIIEEFDVSVTSLKINDSTVARNVTA